MLKRTLVTLILFAVLPACSHAQKPLPAEQSPQGQATPPNVSLTADQILDRYVQALGGEAANRRLTGRVTKGEITIDGQSGTFEIYEKAPDKHLIVIQIPGVGSVREGFDGRVGWTADPADGVREVRGAELTDLRREADFYRELRLREVYPRIELKGAESVNGREAYALEMFPADRKPETMYFDKETGLLVRFDFVSDGPDGEERVENYLDDYREVDGVKFSFAGRHKAGSMEIVQKVREMIHVAELDDKMFSKPARP